MVQIVTDFYGVPDKSNFFKLSLMSEHYLYTTIVLLLVLLSISNSKLCSMPDKIRAISGDIALILNCS